MTDSPEKKEAQFFEGYLLAQLAIVSHNLSTDFHVFLRDHGISPSKWRILSNLYDSPGMYVNELVTTTLLEQSHITKLTDQLCKEGLTRKVVSPPDRRRVNVQITDEGKAAVEPLMAQAIAHEEKVLADLGARDGKRLKEILTKLVRPHLDDMRSKRTRAKQKNGA